ncbi:MAG: nucleotidyltransferase domain-containing protein, partial [Dehalococcoidia bacterium]
MAPSQALARYLEARSAVAGRASVSAPSSEATRRRGADLSAYLTECLDAAMVDLSQGAEGWAVVAIGGYGRGDLARHSDIDVLLLVEEGAADRALRSLYPLWDAALKVGHAIRSVREIADSAQSNVETYTALLDTRLLAGDTGLYEAFVRDRRSWVRKTRDWLRDELVVTRAARVGMEPWQTLAVDVKNSRGGL